jgi:hypothetical protein
MRAHRHFSNSANAVLSIPRQSKRAGLVVGVAMEQLSIGTAISDRSMEVHSCDEFAKAQAPQQPQSGRRQH